MSKDKSKATKVATKEVSTKKVKKATKQVERENIATSDFSKTVTTILALTKKIKNAKGETLPAKTEQTKPGVVRVYLEDKPILRITGLTQDLPTVYIRPKLRISTDGKEAREEFTKRTGITNPHWKRVGGGSGAYFYDGEKSEAMLAGVAKYLTRAPKIVNA